MKKLFSLLLITILALGLVGCSGVGLHDDSEDNSRFGKVIVSPEGVQKNTGSEVKDVSEDTVVKVNGKEKKLGEEISLPTGTYDITVLDSSYGIQLKDIQVKTAETKTLQVENNLIKAEGKVKFSVNPANYDDVDNIDSIYLAGNMNSWSADKSSYQLEDKNGDGVYTLTTTVIAGDQYKYVINGDWFTPQDTDKLVDGEGSNGVVTFTRVVE